MLWLHHSFASWIGSRRFNFFFFRSALRRCIFFPFWSISQYRIIAWVKYLVCTELERYNAGKMQPYLRIKSCEYLCNMCICHVNLQMADVHTLLPRSACFYCSTFKPNRSGLEEHHSKFSMVLVIASGKIFALWQTLNIGHNCCTLCIQCVSK